MSRKPNTHGGGAQTNTNGLQFERETSLLEIIAQQPNFSVEKNIIKENNIIVAKHYEKHSLYKAFLEKEGVDYKSILSKKLLPDEAFLVKNTLFIIEKKYQSGAGSVDEKLQTCDFKKKQYTRLLAPLNIKVEYYYLLNNWFKQDAYRDVLSYINSVDCKYFFDEIPLSEIGL